MKSNFAFLAFVLSISVLTIKAQTLQQGDRMPQFYYYSNGTFLNSDNLNGKIVLVNFAASWCAPCREELPYVETDIFEKYGHNSRFVLLVFGVGETTRSIQRFKINQGLYLPMLPDTDRSIFTSFGEKYLPATFIIDAEGYINYHSTGFHNNLDQVTDRLEALLDL